MFGRNRKTEADTGDAAVPAEEHGPATSVAPEREPATAVASPEREPATAVASPERAAATTVAPPEHDEGRFTRETTGPAARVPSRDWEAVSERRTLAPIV